MLEGPVRPLRVAVLPLIDGRRTEPAEGGLYTYRGRTYRGTDLDRMEPDGAAGLTEAVARQLVHEAVFREIVLVLRRDQAPEADLFISGRVVRARGYVESEPSESGQVWVLGEVEIADVRVEDEEGRLRFHGETGWAFHRRVSLAQSRSDPWRVLSEALAVSVNRLADVWREADFRSFEARETVQVTQDETDFTRLDRLTPPGWASTGPEASARPRGWAGRARCIHRGFEALQTLRFHRLLGPYVPAVHVWRCPADVELAWMREERFPARLLGTDEEGRWLFVSQVGASNWPRADEAIERALAPEPPPTRHVFRLPIRGSESRAKSHR